MDEKETLPPPTPAARALTFLGLGMLALSLLCAAHGREPFHTWLFLFVWWGYILLADGWVHRRRGESLLLTYPGRFLFFALWSVALWFIFEAVNLRLRNWTYVNLPSLTPLRWAGYLLSFATVVPGLMETADLAQTAGFFKERRVRPLGWKRRVEPALFAAGAAMLILPLLWPRIFYPLIWGAFICLLEPLTQRLGAPSLLTDWREGRAGRLFVLLASGLFCGLLWEAANSLAKARWAYDIPGAVGWKLFEMPALGYLGFPLFAVAVFSMTSLALALWDRASRPVRFLIVPGLAGFSLAMCRVVDLLSVQSFQ